LLACPHNSKQPNIRITPESREARDCYGAGADENKAIIESLRNTLIITPTISH
jgi:hypothetical protein